jgi:Spy/CpxP family protein refolding chaperone
MRTVMKWALVLVVPAAFAVTARPAEPNPPEGMTIRLLLLRQKSVQKELEITPDQAAKIKEFTHAQSEAVRKLRDAGEEERKEAHQKLAKENKEFLEKTLTAQQNKRLHQITMQFTALHHLTSPELVKELNLSDEQVQKLKDLQKESRKEVVAILTAKEREGKKEKFAKHREEVRTKVNAILTDDQKAKVREIAGPQFEGEIIFEEEEEIDK